MCKIMLIVMSCALAALLSCAGAAAAGSGGVASVDYSKVMIKKKALYVPSLEEARDVLSSGLASSFECVDVSVVDSPDLSQPPHSLAAPGFAGDPWLVDLGGTEYLVPEARRDKVYDLKELLRFLRRDPALLLGAGAGPWPYLGVGCECIVDMCVRNGSVTQRTRIASVQPRGAAKNVSTCVLESLPATETRVALLGNYLLSEGKPGRVIKICVKNRTGSDNFITAIRKTLKTHFDAQDKVVGLGGTFMMNSGKAVYHVMPEYSKTPLTTEAAVNDWLHFFELSAPVVHVGTLVTGDMGLNLRVQHFHGYTAGGGGGGGGHYDWDTRAGAAQYEGYFSFAGGVLRLDPPPRAAALGRD